MDFEVEVDLDEVKELVESPDFAQFLLSHTTQFSSAAFILQTLLDAIYDAVQSLDNTENIWYNIIISYKGCEIVELSWKSS